ncbi:dihydrodipicolinate synthase family protein [Blastococcus haudaquaticus]|uniref:4-hydroxy-tetrahydrodipicolinate synthase n=1 Tax=Blastococcus haudaquaticus TaxID=1938745 RepID=A0A286GSK3_9ACTN|nr:dihydrodipicolinate synthase family protein [Blastococcus haudaquaticus]SOD98176.1 4-hydroxy-tetrahydrodipicolinate synthase [Blastococcus haudaquaticus]
MPLFTGVGVALVTLFRPDGALDAPATADLAGQLVGLGVRCVLVAGTTGEAAALTREERDTVVGAVRAALPADVPVLAGTGAPTGRQAAELAERAFGAGADAVLALSPPGVPDPRPYYDTVAEVATGPLLAYHLPAAAAPGIPVDLLADLPVAGLKDSSGDADRLLHECDVFGGDLYTGAVSLVGLCGAVGGAGALVAVANFAPEDAVATFAGDAEAQLRSAAADRTAFADFPAGYKRAAAQRFGTSAVTRVGR